MPTNATQKAFSRTALFDDFRTELIKQAFGLVGLRRIAENLATLLGNANAQLYSMAVGIAGFYECDEVSIRSPRSMAQSERGERPRHC